LNSLLTAAPVLALKGFAWLLAARAREIVRIAFHLLPNRKPPTSPTPAAPRALLWSRKRDPHRPCVNL
jgi:hypothetical protein